MPRFLPVLILLALACRAAAAVEGPPVVSSAAERREVALALYDQGFGLVREVRRATLPDGEALLEFRDVAQTVEPETVRVGGDVRVLEQRYRYDLLSPQSLLERYVGRRVRVYRWNEKEGRDEAVEAEVLAASPATVLRIGDEITSDIPGARLAFPALPEGLVARPTLLWRLRGGGARDLEVSYLARGLGWKTDYVLALRGDGSRASLSAWVTLTNESGASWQDARLELVSGEVQRAAPPQPVFRRERMATMEMDAAAAPMGAGFQERGVFEYHVYALERPIALEDHESKQVALLEARDVGVARRLVLEGQPEWFRMQQGEPSEPQSAEIKLEVVNAEADGLGRPLPQGIVRVYQVGERTQQFLGEDRIRHTARDETLRLTVGRAFDVVGERRQTDFRVLGQCSSESAWEIALRNRKQESVEVEVVEHAGGDWEIVDSSHKPQKRDASSFVFRVPVPASGSATVTYRARVRWC